MSSKRRCNFLDNKNKSDYKFKIIWALHITIKVNIFFLVEDLILPPHLCSLENQDWYVERMVLSSRLMGAERIHLEAWKKMSSSHMFWMRTTLFHSSQHDLAGTVILPGTRQCLAKPTKKSASGRTASYSSRGMQQTDKAKTPWQGELTSSRHLKQKGWTEQRYLLILNSHLNQQALWATKRRDRKCYSVLNTQEADLHMQPENGLSRGIYKAAALWWMKTLSLSWCLSMVLD